MERFHFEMQYVQFERTIESIDAMDGCLEDEKKANKGRFGNRQQYDSRRETREPGA